MSIQQQLTYELRGRVEMIPEVVEELKGQAAADDNGMGIHQSQINMVKSVLDKMKEEQGSLIQDFVPTLPFDDFTEKRSEIEQFLTVTNSIMATFRYIFTQRNESKFYKTMLDIADLVAAYCYRPFMQIANSWRGLPRDYFREPPLIYLNAMLSPAAISRRHNLNQVGLKLYTDTENRLPISVISLPFHDMVAIWTFCSLYHEVGHLLDNDLGLRDELKTALTKALTKGGQDDPVSEQRQAVWESWLGEMIADTFGVLIGGVGFAYALLNMMFRPKEEISTVGEDKHPNEYLRVYLLCALLRETGVEPLKKTADEIEQTWHEAYGDSAPLASYLPECKTVANVLMTTKLDALKNSDTADSEPHALKEFGYKLEANHQKVVSLSRWLREEVDRPEPAAYPYQLVPAAAQMAVRDVTENFEEKYKAIQQRTLDFIGNIEHDKFLAPDANTADRRAYLKKMVADLKFAAIKI